MYSHFVADGNMAVDATQDCAREAQAKLLGKVPIPPAPPAPLPAADDDDDSEEEGISAPFFRKI